MQSITKTKTDSNSWPEDCAKKEPASDELSKRQKNEKT
ncbi:hypothetical protein ES703_51626 [subsurface metagenome]|jgi:hypothetical protein